jgi:hypothetical protein
MDILVVEEITNLPVTYVRSTLVRRGCIITCSRQIPQREQHGCLRHSICLQVVCIDFASHCRMFASVVAVLCSNRTFAGVLLLARMPEVQHVDCYAQVRNDALLSVLILSRQMF